APASPRRARRASSSSARRVSASAPGVAAWPGSMTARSSPSPERVRATPPDYFRHRTARADLLVGGGAVQYASEGKTARARRIDMSTITTKDGVEIFYKDWGEGQPIVFSHGWPLSADDWDAQIMFFLNHGYRVIAHDRRGHGRSSQTGDGHDMDHYADDLAAVTEHLDLRDAIHVGHSTGGGEVVRYIARHGESRVGK